MALNGVIVIVAICWFFIGEPVVSVRNPETRGYDRTTRKRMKHTPDEQEASSGMTIIVSSIP